MADKNQYSRTPPRLKDVCISSPVYFITCCTHQRQQLLAGNTVHRAFRSFSRQGFEERNIAVGRYVIMPDHIHFFVRGSYDFRLGIWMSQLKGFLTKQIRNCSRSPVANDSCPEGNCYRKTKPVWQRGFFDHLLRSHESDSEKWMYAEQNPVRAGLVENAKDWPYAGCITEIRL